VPEGPPATLNDFMTQPASAGGKSLSFNVVGTRYVGTVVRNVTDADIERATEVRGGGLATHPDGRPKVVMKVPLLMQPSAEFPTGVGVWYVKGNERSELLRAMEAAGAEPGPPRGGDIIDITYTHDEPSRAGMSPRKVKRVVYTKGNGVAPELPQAQQAAPPAYGQPTYGQQPAYGQQPQMQMAPPAPPQPQYQQQVPVAQGYAPSGLPDPNLAYQQATGQQMPPQAQFQQPQYAGTIPPEYSNGYGQPQAQQPPQDLQSAYNPMLQGVQVVPPTPGAAPAAPAYTNGAPPTVAASPSSAPGGPPPGWPADVPFIPGLTPDQARVAATMHHPAAAGQ
jgi:hypothetical protein